MSVGVKRRRARLLLPDIGRLPRPLHVTLAWARARRAPRAALAVIVVAVPDLLAVELLLAVTLYVFRNAIQHGLVFHEADTTTMFYPIYAALHAALARGDLLLWSADLFSGFPLLAEGQAGMLYPLNWLSARLLPVREGFVWIRIVHFAMAAVFAYMFGRVVRLGPAASAILALSFTFGSYMVGQMQHQSVLASAVWLPLVLALTDLGLRARSIARLALLVFAGLALGMSALGAHLQTVVMAGGCLVGWIVFRMLFPPSRRAAEGCPDETPSPRLSRRPRTNGVVRRTKARVAEHSRSLSRRLSVVIGRVGVAVWALTLIPLTGIGVAAVQLLPLQELSVESGRANTWSYLAATAYSLPVPNLLTLVFPFFFRDGAGGGWALWQTWEVTYYAGVVPLALAFLGLLRSWRSEALFFGLLVVVATLLALGDYSPVNLYAQVWELPGINFTRAPARFSYLGVFGLAVLAGLGAQVLSDKLRLRADGIRQTLWFLLIWVIGLIVAVGALIWQLGAWRAWLQDDLQGALQLIGQNYLGQRHDPGVIDSPEKVYTGLWQSLALTNHQTALALVLLCALLFLVLAWNELRKTQWLWQGLLVLLVAADLAMFAQNYHPKVSLDQITDVGQAGRFLAEQDRPVRVHTDPRVDKPKANQLLPAGIAEVKAYDPLELGRHGVMMGVVSYVDNWLLDLLGVRYRLLNADAPGMPSYRETAFDPEHPLVSGTAFNPSGREAWTIADVQSDELRVVTVLEEAFGIREGERVAEWVLTDSTGRQIVIPMRAGTDTADWMYDDPANVARPAHSRGRVAHTFQATSMQTRPVHLYYSAFSLTDRPTIRRAEFRYTNPVGRMKVFGFGLFNRDGGRMAQFFGREKYRLPMRLEGVLAEENAAAFPRAFAVPDAVPVDSPEEALDTLLHQPFQPRRQVVLEDAGANLGREKESEKSASGVRASDPLAQRSLAQWPGGRLGEPYGDVQLLSYADRSAAIHANTDGGYLVLNDAFYPGWKAYLNGDERPVLRANYLFRAIELPPGEHHVEFRYEPASFEIGLMMTRLTLAFVGVCSLAFAVAWFRSRRGPGEERTEQPLDGVGSSFLRELSGP